MLWPWNVVWLVFASWVNSYADEWEDHPNNWGTTHPPLSFDSALELSCHMGVSFSLQIGDQGLVEFDLSSWTHLILIGVCYVLVLSYSFKSCALSHLLLFHALS